MPPKSSLEIHAFADGAPFAARLTRALGRIRAAGERSVVRTETVPHRTNAIRVARLVADALQPRRAARR